MENWFLADAVALATYFGQGFTSNALPKRGDVEAIPKAAVYAALSTATKNCRTKASYGKGAHSFEILTRVDPSLLAKASPWAARFIAAPRAAP